MTKYRVVLDEDLKDYEEEFDTAAEAEDYGMQLSSEYRTGCEVLHMSNPGDYEESDDGLDFDIVEIED